MMHAKSIPSLKTFPINESFFPGKGFVAGGDGGAVWVDILGKGAV